MADKEVDISELLRRAPQGRNEELIAWHKEAGLSMYGADPRYPDFFVELTPEGEYFLVRQEQNAWVRVREIPAP